MKICPCGQIADVTDGFCEDCRPAKCSRYAGNLDETGSGLCQRCWYQDFPPEREYQTPLDDRGDLDERAQDDE